MADLDMLAQVLRGGSQGKAELAGLNEQFTRASDMRDNRTAKPNQYGYTSPMSVMADVINQSRGRKDMRELAPQRAAARQKIAGAENAFPLYQARQGQENFDTGEANKLAATGRLAKAKLNAVTAKDAKAAELLAAAQAREDAQLTASQKYEAELLAAKDAKAAELLAAKNKQVATAPVEYTDDKGKARQLSRLEDGKWADGTGAVVDSIAGWTKTPTSTKTETTQKHVGSYGGKTSDKNSEKNWSSIRRVDSVNERIARMTPEQAELFNSEGNKAKMAFIRTMAPDEFAAQIENQFSGYDAATQDMLNALNAMSAEQRHELFGSALTPTEYKSSQAFLASTVGRGLPWMQAAMERTKQNNVNDLLGADQAYTGNKYRTALTKAGIISDDYQPAAYPLGGQPSVGSALNTFEDGEEAEYQAWKATQGVK